MSNPHVEGTPTEIGIPKTIKHVSRIEKSDSMLQRRADIKKLVEEPLVPACERLYDLNICTWRASANSNDINQGYGVISIDFPSLSEHNKTIAQELFERREAELTTPEDPRLVILRIPLKETSTIGDVSDAALKLAERFGKQEMTWATRYTLEQMRDWLKSPNKPPEEIAQEVNLFYDPETKTFFINEEQCLKTKEKVDDDK